MLAMLGSPRIELKILSLLSALCCSSLIHANLIPWFSVEIPPVSSGENKREISQFRGSETFCFKPSGAFCILFRHDSMFRVVN
jgi:hypothetical protein